MTKKIEIGYRVSDIFPWNHGEIEVQSASISDFEFDLFPGNILFTIDGKSFSVDWQWIPILGFCIGLKRAVVAVERAEIGRVYFTENTHQLILVKIGAGELAVFSTYCEHVAITGIERLNFAVESFIGRTTEVLSENWPSLMRNVQLMNALFK